jgi:transglutaminase-like putative cysteine protease
MRRHRLTIAAVAVWLGMMALQARRQIPAPATAVDDLPAPLVAAVQDDEWFGVYQGGRKIGHTHRTTTRTPDGWRHAEESRFALALMGVPQPLTTSMVADVDAAHTLRRVRFSLVSAAATFAASGESDGRRLALRYGTGGGTQEMMVPLDGPIQLPATLRARIAAARPAAGTAVEQAVFTPLGLRPERVRTVVEGDDAVDGRPAQRLREEHRGLAAHVWLDAGGRVLREEGGMGLELRAEPRQIALAGVEGAAPLDLALATRVPLEGTIAHPRDRATMTLRVRGDAATRIPDDPPRQRVRDGILRIEREALPAVAAADAPLPARWIAPSPFIESDDPAIVSRARAIAGADPDPVPRARRLLAWVHGHVTPEPAMTVPSAREVLRSRRGDCNEHAVLLAALARAAGVPARVVAGLIVTGDGVFAWHAWNELWLGEWVSADAVFEQLPADATHVKLIEGGPERHLELAELVGKLDFAVMEDGPS